MELKKHGLQMNSISSIKKDDLYEQFADILLMEDLANQQQPEVENDLLEAGINVSHKLIPKNNVKNLQT